MRCLREVEAHACVLILFPQWQRAAADRMRRRRIDEVVIFVFFTHKKYSHSFITLQLNPWCHMDYFIDVLATFLELGTFQLHCCLWEGQRALEFHQKYLHLCFEDKQKTYGFGTTWGWVINDRIFIFGWTNTLNFIYLTSAVSYMQAVPADDAGRMCRVSAGERY